MTNPPLLDDHLVALPGLASVIAAGRFSAQRGIIDRMQAEVAACLNRLGEFLTNPAELV